MPLETPAAPAAPTPAAPVQPVVQQPPVVEQPVATITAPPVAPPAVQTVTIPLEQLQAFTSIQARLAEMEANQRAQQVAADREKADLLLAKGQAEEAVRMLRDQSDAAIKVERDQRLQELERSKRYALDNEITGVLAGVDFINDRARQSFASEIRHEFVVEPQGNGFVVRTPTFQGVRDFVAGKIAHADYQYMLRPINPGGGTQTPGQLTQQAPAAPAGNPQPTPVERPRNLGEAFILDYRNAAASRTTTGDPRSDPSRPFALTSAALRPAAGTG